MEESREFSWEEFGWEAEGEVAFLEAVGVVAAQGGEGPEDLGEGAEGVWVFVDGAWGVWGNVGGVPICSLAGAVAEGGDEFGW